MSSIPFSRPPLEAATRFSVVIATYNQKQYLLEAVFSVVHQSYPAYEVIVVLDGCTDGTAEALRQAFPSVRLVEQSNCGKCIARNTGLELASGDWVCFLDHDDLWHRRKLEILSEYAVKHPNCSAIVHDAWLFSEFADGPDRAFSRSRDFVAASLDECHARASVLESREGPHNARIVDFESALARDTGTTSSLCVKRSIAIRAGGFCPMQFNGEDWTFSVNVARMTPWHMLSDRLCFTRLHGTSGSFDGIAGLSLAAAFVNAWYGGRPLDIHVKGLEFRRELAAHGLVYRQILRDIVWGALVRFQIRVASIAFRMGLLLLPRFRDRLLMAVPPLIAHRLGI